MTVPADALRLELLFQIARVVAGRLNGLPAAAVLLAVMRIGFGVFVEFLLMPG